MEEGGRMSDIAVITKIVTEGFFDQDLVKKIQADSANGGRVLHPFGIALIASRALKLGAEHEAGDRQPLTVIGEMLLTTNDIATEGDQSEEARHLRFIRDLSVSNGENNYFRVGRYYRLFKELAPTMKNSSPESDIATLYTNATGMSIDAIFTLMLALYGKFAELGNRSRTRSNSPAFVQPTLEEFIIAPNQYFKKTTMNQDIVQRSIYSLSTNPKQYMADTNRTDLPFDFTHLRTWPLVQVGKDNFVVPVIDFLFNRMATRIYFDIYDSLGEKQKGSFGNFVGGLVQVYINEVLTSFLGQPGSALARWYSDQQFEKDRPDQKTPDAIIVGQDRGKLVLAFLEFKSARPRNRAMVAGDIASLQQQWRHSLIGTPDGAVGARQLDSSISDFFKGRLRIPGVNPNVIDRIYPVIITIDPWPLVADMKSTFLADVGENGLLTQTNVATLDVWSCFDLETLGALVEKRKLALFKLMRIRSSDPNKRLVPISLQLAENGVISEERSEFFDAIWKRLHDNVVTDLDLKSAND
jgi:hypothetical protein